MGWSSWTPRTPTGGRVSAVEYVVGVGGPGLGNARGGFVAGWTSPAVSGVSSGLSVAVAMALLAAGIPALARHRAPRGPVDERDGT